VGGCCPIVWTIKLNDKKIRAIKYTLALNCCWMTISYATTNQKHAERAEEGMDRKCKRWGPWGKCNSIILRALLDERGEK
jgi:hypothetical protein